MDTEPIFTATTVNVQEKANLIWAIADKLVGTYKPHEYGLVVLPMCVIKRFSDALLPALEAHRAQLQPLLFLCGANRSDVLQGRPGMLHPSDRFPCQAV